MYIPLSTKNNKSLESFYPKDKCKIRVCTKSSVNIILGKNLVKITNSLLTKEKYILNFPFRMFIYADR